MSVKEIEIQVFKLDNDTFDAIGQINEFTSLIWPDKFSGFTEEFELNAPVTEENKLLIKQGNVIWCGGDNAAEIEIIEATTNDEGQKSFKAKGRTLEKLLTNRIIWGIYSCSNKVASTAMYEIVDMQCVNPVQTNRKIPYLECAEDEAVGRSIYFQKTGGEVYEALQSISADSELGFCILFRPIEKKLIFKVLQGVDRTEQGDPKNFVIFSTELEDILASSYYINGQDEKTTAYVAGEGEGSARKYIISGDNDLPGFKRKEMYVDARDLQSEVANEDGTTTIINEDEYRDMLNDRGKEKLAEQVVTQSFETKIRVTGETQYKYGENYNLGDKVYIQDTDLGITAETVVSEVREGFSDTYSLDVIFGHEYPSLIQRIKKQVT